MKASALSKLSRFSTEQSQDTVDPGTALATGRQRPHWLAMQSKIDDLRGKAEHCRWLGRQIDDPAIKKTLLDAAHDYGQEAFRLERKAKKSGR
jgi:hypothetical protein